MTLDATFATIAILANFVPQKIVDHPNWPAALISSFCSVAFVVVVRRSILRHTGLTALWYFAFAVPVVFWFFLETYFAPDHAPTHLAQATWLDVVVFPWSTTALVLLVLAVYLSNKRAGPELSPPISSLLLFSGGAFGMFLGGLLAVMGLSSMPLMSSVASVRLAHTVSLAHNGLDASTLCREFPFDESDACRGHIDPRDLSRSGMELTYVSGAALCGAVAVKVDVRFDANGRISGVSTKPDSSFC